MNLIPLEFAAASPHSDDINGIAITDDGSLAVTASYDRTLRTWDMHARSLGFVLEGHRRSIAAVATLPGTHRAISASQDGEAKMWNLETGDLEWTFAGHGAEVLAVAASPSGTSFATASHDGSVKTWDWAERQETSSIDVSSFERGPLAVDLNKFTFRAEMEAWLKTVRIVGSLSYLPGGRALLCGTMGGNVYLCDLEPMKQSAILSKHTGVVSSVAVSKGGKWALTASYDRKLALWNLQELVCALCLEGHLEPVFGACFVPQTPYAVSVSGDRSIIVWDLRSGIKVATHTAQFPLYSCAASPDGQVVLAGTGGKTGRLFGFRLSQ